MIRLPKKISAVLLILNMVFALKADAFAQPHQQGYRPEHQPVIHEAYRYHDGRFYRPLFFGLFQIAMAVPPMGAVVAVLPSGYRTIIIGSITYYYWDNVYYAATPSGYVVVPAPKLSFDPGQAIIVNVPNSNGSYTPVILIKKNGGYVGPQGEYYPDHPTITQLKVLYGN